MYMTHPIFPTPNIRKTADFYVQKLGFNAVEYLNSKEPYICLYKDDIEIILTDSKGQKVVPNHELYGYGYDVYIIVNNQEELQKEFDSKRLKVVKRLSVTDYNNKELVLEDIDGRWLAFGVKLDADKWKTEYLKEEQVLKDVLKDYDVEILCMGVSKYTDGTIDFPIKIAIGFEDHKNEKEIIKILQTLGYYYADLNSDHPDVFKLLTKFRNNIKYSDETHIIFLQCKHSVLWKNPNNVLWENLVMMSEPLYENRIKEILKKRS